MKLTRPKIVKNDLAEIARLCERLAVHYETAFSVGLEGFDAGNDEVGFIASSGEPSDPVGDIVVDDRCDSAREASRRAAKAVDLARRDLHAALVSLARSITDAE